jgi:C-terminal processing protease CtpA/Prc
MLRIGCVLIVLLSPAFALSEEKEKQKPSMIGVQIAVGKDEGTIVVRMVINNSPAEKAGLKSGDIFKRINGIKPADLATTVKVIRSLKPGKKVKLLIEREGKEKTLEVVPMAADGSE